MEELANEIENDSFWVGKPTYCYNHYMEMAELFIEAGMSTNDDYLVTLGEDILDTMKAINWQEASPKA